jgi:hypothetical protein
VREPRVDCPLCGKRMEEGFVLAVDVDSNAATQAHWVEGKPEFSRWLGVKIKGRRRLPIATYRCAGCGYLASFAPSA